MPVEEALKLTEGFYGYEEFQKAANKILIFKNYFSSRKEMP